MDKFELIEQIIRREVGALISEYGGYLSPQSAGMLAMNSALRWMKFYSTWDEISLAELAGEVKEDVSV